MAQDDEDDRLRDFADRAIRDALRNPTNLREFLGDALPTIVEHLDFSKANYLPRDFLLDDWRGRESDLLVEIPFRWNEVERTILICILLEHQTNPDARMPLRTLIYTVLYWERKWKEWTSKTKPRPPFVLQPVIPIVLHTGSKPWTTNRRLTDLVDGPDELKQWIPNWEPMFWELSQHDPQRLMNSEEAFLQVLSVVRLEEAERAEFEAAFRETSRRLEALHGNDHVRWYDLLRFVITWAGWRRPRNERKEWWEMAETIQTDAARQREVRAMRKTIGEEIYDEGRVDAVRDTIVRQGTKRFGPPNPDMKQKLDAIVDLEQLHALSDKVIDANSWSELIATE